MTDQDAREFRRYRWLSAMSEHLSPSAREIWSGLKERFGEQEHLDRLGWPTEWSWATEESPVGEETLGVWSIAEIVRYCAAYAGPEESFDRGSKEGLAEVLTKVVQARPREFAASATEFLAFADKTANRDNPRFVVSLFRGLQQSIRTASADGQEQEGLIETLAATLSPTVTQLVSRLEGLKTDQQTAYVPTWESARREAADCLLFSLEALSRLPPEAIGSVIESSQEPLLGALRSLQSSEDPAPSEDTEDPLHVCINSTRGRALHAFIAFQQCWDLWSRMTREGSTSANRLHPGVAGLLEERLRDEQSAAVRCVFGWRLPYLYNLSSQWVKDHLGEILPDDGARQLIWWATWDAYITSNRLHKVVWDLLVPHYRRAVGQLAQRPYKRAAPGHLDERLGDHIFLAWFAGFEDAESMLVAYIEQSNDSLRSHIVEFGSRVLESNVTSPGLSEQSKEWTTMERFWRERISGEGAFGVTTCGAKEAAAFASWLRFSPARLPRLKPLIEASISRVTKEESEWHVKILLDYLCDQSTDFPVEAAELISNVALSAWPRWMTAESVESVISALRRAHGQPNGEGFVKLAVDRLAWNHLFEYHRALQNDDGGG